MYDGCPKDRDGQQQGEVWKEAIYMLPVEKFIAFSRVGCPCGATDRLFL